VTEKGISTMIHEEDKGCEHISVSEKEFFKTAPHNEAGHSEQCSGHHHHVDVEETSGTRLLITLGLNLIIPVIQVIAGTFAHSMALVSDATHNFSDFTAVLLSYIAYRIGRKGASLQNTFGYRRAEIMAALLNVIILVGACIFILYGAIQRFLSPEVVSGKIVIWAAMVGIVGNGFSAWLLHRDAKHNLNVKGAFLHMLGDFLTSVVVMISGIVMFYRPWYWLDPVLSVFIAVFILKNCWDIFKSSTKILMNATPSDIDLEAVHEALVSIDGIKSAHYLHAWPVSSSGICFSCHLVVKDQMLTEIEKLSKSIRHMIFHKFGIDHPVLQFETELCGRGTLLCETFAAKTKGKKVDQQNRISINKGNNGSNDQPKAKIGPKTYGYLYHIARMVLGVIFIYASLDKIIHPQAFAQAVFNYQLLPDSFINLTALILPWLELILGCCLIFNRWMPGTSVISITLLTVFMAAILFNLSRGLDISCGCFSTNPEEGSMNRLTLIRDASFLIPAIYLVFMSLFKNNGKNQFEEI